MVNQDGSPLERAIEGHQGLVRQGGDLLEQALALALERVRLEAEQAERKAQEVRASHPTGTATQIISAPQTPVSRGGYAVRDIFRPLEALVLQGPASVGGIENYRSLVFERISDAVRQIYKDSGYNDPSSIIWCQRENEEGWSNNLIYLCNSCNAVQRKDTKEKLTTPGEYALIYDAFRLAKILLHEDTASCAEQPKTAKEGVYTQPTGGVKGEATTQPQTLEQRAREIEALKKSIGGEWYQTKPDGTGGWWNSLYLICIHSGKAYSRQTGEELKRPDIGKVFNYIGLSPYENMCPINPLYNSTKDSLPEAAKLTGAAELRIKEHCQGLHNYEPPKK